MRVLAAGDSSAVTARRFLRVMVVVLGLPAASGVHGGEAAQARWQWFPLEQMYPRYLADPLRTTFSFQAMALSRSTLANAGRKRFLLKVGGPLGIVRRVSAANPARGWQVTLEAAINGQFDVDQSQDNIGWDGIYGLYLSGRHHRSLAWRVGLRHISAHVGDEFMERTGRARIEYTREELRAGLAWLPGPDLVVYVDAGGAHDLRNRVLQKTWRVQAGVQVERPRAWWDGAGSWYAALDVAAWEEDDWARSYSAQAGIVFPVHERCWRFGLAYHDGRSAMGEFFQARERFLALGVWLDI